MDTMFFIVALITSGVALGAGLNGVMVGLNRESEKTDLVFGIQSILLFIFIMLPPQGFIGNVNPPYPVSLDVKRVFIWCYYAFFPVFFSLYSGYQNRALKWAIFLGCGLSYLVLLSTRFWDTDRIFRTMVVVSSLMIILYGLRAAKYQALRGDREGANWLRLAMYIYAILSFMQLPFFLVPAEMKALTGLDSFPSFNLNSLAFTLIMGFRLRKNINQKFRIERKFRLQNSRWEQLLHNVQLLVVEVDKQGLIKYINPFGIRCAGAQSLQMLEGRHWIDTFCRPNDRSRVKELISGLVSGESSQADLKFTMVGLDGATHNISWTPVLVTDEDGSTSGLMSIGVDTTRLDQAFREVETLKNELTKENLHLKEVITDEIESEIIGNSEATTYAIQKARQVAETHATVLLEGETGVGKELFANLIHRVSSLSLKPLIKVNCAALPDELIESELFGHEKGAFTGALQARKGRFELADGGTIFLDEVSELPLPLQAKLLRVLQSGEFERVGGQQTLKVHVRVISATNRDLMNEVHKGRFREDLYYRLNVYPITIPPLRKRKSEIPLLVDHFIRRYALEFNKGVSKISRADLHRLMDYQWPGNVRELMNLIERSMISATGDTLKIAWESGSADRETSTPAVLSIKDLERDHILKVLADTHWKINGINGAAEKLGLNPNTLRSRMKKLNIVREEH